MDVQRLSEAGTTVAYDDGTVLNLGIDEFNSHVQPQGGGKPEDATGGLYHYHGYPGWDDGDYADYVIGYAKDGVPIMGRETELANGNQASSSYKLRSGKNGAFHMDYEYVSGRGSLDEFNGGMVMIDGEEVYAYCSTSGYPYLFRNFHGEY